MTLLERDLESTIEEFLTEETKVYKKGSWKDFDFNNLVMPAPFIDFLKESQPDEWARYVKTYGVSAESKILERLHKEVLNKGLIETLRSGITDAGISFHVAYYRPETSFNEESVRRYGCNRLTCSRQFHFSRIRTKDSVDMVILLNGLPIVTMELKNEYTGKSVADSKQQYRERNPREPFFGYDRSNLVYICADTSEVWTATRLDGEDTYFMPFNQGSNGSGEDGGKGNPQVDGKYQTSYLWEHILSKDVLLDIVRNFIHRIKDRSSGRDFVIFPRYHQLDAVSRIVDDVRANGPGRNYLVQHSAGSGKSNTIAWLSYRLMGLHDGSDRKIFDSVIVITDRRNLDRQLQKTITSFNRHISATVTTVDRNSRQLLEAIADGRPIIVTTLQKFPVIYESVEAAGRKFAIIVDEAHSSQSGTSAMKMKQALGDDGEEYDEQDELSDVLRSHGMHKNLSFFAFTATPKHCTLDVFGSECEDGRKVPFHIYSMRQAIEEGFILDVLKHYTTYRAYYRLAKSVADDPEVEVTEAMREILRYSELHEYNLSQKAEIMIRFFMDHTLPMLDGRAKAMVVTSSRLSAVRYYNIFQKYIERHKIQGVKTLVAFTGTVQDDDTGMSYTEEGINRNSRGEPIKETQLPDYFRGDFNVLIVAEKYQTGFDEPLLQTMFVDKKLWGVKAVQTLSRLNRTMPGKTDVYVLDFANTSEEIKNAFKPFYDYTELEETIDKNSPYDICNKILEYNVLD